MPRFNFHPNALKYAPWSISKMETARNCGAKFSLKYAQNIREPKIARSEGRVGSAAHKMLELILKGTDAPRAYRVAAVDNKLTTNEMDDLLTFKGNINGFLDRIGKFKGKNPFETEYVEHQFGLTVDLKPTEFFAKDVFFRGVWDYGLYLANRDLIVLDHKSGKAEEDTQKYAHQLNTYALAGRAYKPDLKGVQSVLHYIRDGKMVWAPYQNAAVIDSELTDWFVAYINESVANLSTEETPGWYCDFCGYAPKCKTYLASK